MLLFSQKKCCRSDAGFRDRTVYTGGKAMRMKTWITLVLLCCAVLLIGIPGAAGAESGPEFLYRNYDDSITVFGYTGTDTNVVIPAEIDGKPVIQIDGPYEYRDLQFSDAFLDYQLYTFNRSDLVSISIPATVTRIGRDAFVNRDSALREIIVDENNPAYTSVDGVLFDKTVQTLIHYPASRPDEEYMVPQGVQQIEMFAFEGCRNLKKVDIPTSMTRISHYAFYGCGSLRQAHIPSSVTQIENSAFSHSGLTDIEIPDSVTAIGYDAFSGCPNLTRITMADSVTRLNHSAFRSCPALTDVRLSAGLTELGPVFVGCSSLTQIVIPENIKTVSGSFWNCSALSDVTLPDGLLEIGESAFKGCTSLEAIQLPVSLRYIGSGAFAGCTALKQMDFSSSPALLSIDREAFSACTSLREITLPDGMPSLGNLAFERCESLETVNWIHVPVPESLVAKGAINYLPAADRSAMIRMMSRHAAWQKGYTVIADTDKDGLPIDKEAWLDDKKFALQTAISESEESIHVAEAEISNPETPENKKRVLLNRVNSATQAMEEDKTALVRLMNMKLLTDSEACAAWSMDTGIANTSEFDLAIYEQWQNTFVAIQNGEGLPEGYKTPVAYLSSEDGLGIGNADLHALEHITNTFTLNGDGTVYYLPGSGTAGIGDSAFSFCQALKSVTIPASVAGIASNAFARCSADLAITGVPGSYAEQFCQQNNIPFIVQTAEEEAAYAPES